MVERSVVEQMQGAYQNRQEVFRALREDRGLSKEVGDMVIAAAMHQADHGLGSGVEQAKEHGFPAFLYTYIMKTRFVDKHYNQYLSR